MPDAPTFGPSLTAARAITPGIFYVLARDEPAAAFGSGGAPPFGASWSKRRTRRRPCSCSRLCRSSSTLPVRSPFTTVADLVVLFAEPAGERTRDSVRFRRGQRRLADCAPVEPGAFVVVTGEKK